MIRGFIVDQNRLRQIERPEERLDDLIWVDLMSPTAFVLDHGRLITVRYHEPRAFQTFPTRAERADVIGATGNPEVLLVALLEAIVDRIADILERVVTGVDALSRRVFRPGSARHHEVRDFQQILVDIGRTGDFISDITDSLTSLERVAGFLDLRIRDVRTDRELRSQVKTLGRDVRSLVQYAEFLSQKITFLLDATLGMIQIEQNTIVKIFSIVAVLFLPPTLIASIYGMNFAGMPELEWWFGYPLALGLMVLSAGLSYWYFKRRGWL